MPDYPDAQPVRLRFVQKPEYEIVVFGKGLCARLTSGGKEVVAADFDAWGNWRDGLTGFAVLSIDGDRIINAGGWGTASVTGKPGAHPLDEYFK